MRILTRPDNRRSLAPLAAVCLLVLATVLGAPVRAQERQPPGLPAGGAVRDARPNIVMIVTDDLRYDFTGYAGHPLLKTPAIDRLAHEGVVFDNAYVITPLCAPSRATLLTGLRTYTHGIVRNGMTLYASRPTIATRLHAAGYATALIGKFGLSDSSTPRPGFDHWVSFRTRDEGGRGDTYVNPEFNVDGRVERSPGFSADALAKHATDWIQQPHDRPFFLLLALKTPHVPYLPPRRHAKLFVHDPIKLPDSYDDPPDNLPPLLRKIGYGDHPLCIGDPLRKQIESIRNGRPKEDPVSRFVRRYLKMIPSIDETVAKLREALENSGQLDHTVIIFTSDNGMLLGEKGIVGKELAYDPSIRVPLVMRLPGAAHNGRRVAQPVLNLDWAPTLLDLAGASAPIEMHGASLRPLLRGDARTWRRDWLMVSRAERGSDRPDFLAVCSRDWKYIRYVRGALFEELFDLRSDPGERTNLVSKPSAAAQLEHMRTRMGQLLEQAGHDRAWMVPTRR